MRIIKIGFILLVSALLTGCKGQNTGNKNNKAVVGNNLIETILLRQVKAGWALHDDSDDVYNTSIRLSKQDFDASEQEVENILKSSGYIFDSIKFKTKVKDVFGVDGNKKAISPTDKCDSYNFTSLTYDYDNDTKMGLLLFDNEMIFEFYMLPELIDYQKEYPEIAKAELAMPKKRKLPGGNNFEYSVSLWSEYSPEDREHNIHTLISRNKYLFNDDSSQFDWLVQNDSLFMDRLVTVFGYTKDKKLLDWVMTKNYSNPGDFVSKYVFTKDCQGNLEIREDILKYIEETTNDKENTYAHSMLSYIAGLVIDRNTGKHMDFTDPELFKIIAYSSNYMDTLIEKYYLNGLSYTAGNTIDLFLLYPFYHEDTQEKWDKFVKQIKENNYYGLPNLKKAIDGEYSVK